MNSVYLFCILYSKAWHLYSYWYRGTNFDNVGSSANYFTMDRGRSGGGDRVVIITLPHPVTNGTVEPQVAAPL